MSAVAVVDDLAAALALTVAPPEPVVRTLIEGYVYDVLPADDPGPAVKTRGGVQLVPRPIAGRLAATMFGRFGGTSASAATDTAALQCAVDVALYRVGAPLVIDLRTVHLSDTLHVGYGDTYRSGRIAGLGRRYGGGEPFAGTTLFAAFADRPALNVQGGRDVVIEEITLVGPNAAHVDRLQLGQARTGPVDTHPASWVDPALGPGADSRYAPCAGITVDAYGGSEPAGDAARYPGALLPAFVRPREVGAYRRLTSRTTTLHHVEISGFVAGFVNQPGDVDAIGDFTKLIGCRIQKCKYAISIGNSQSRNVAVRDCEIFNVFTAFTNRRHGKAIGKYNGSIDNVSLVSAVNLFDIRNTVYAGPLSVTSLYVELGWRIGDILMPASQEAGIVFTGCRFHMQLQNDERGVPATLLETGSYDRPGPIVFRACQFRVPRVVVLDAINVRLEGCQSDPWDWSGGGLARAEPLPPYLRLANNATAGGFVFGRAGRALVDDHSIAYRPFDIDSGDDGRMLVAQRGFRGGRRNLAIPAHVGTIRPLDREDEAAVDPAGRTLRPARPDAITLSGPELRLTLPDGGDDDLAEGPEVGDVAIERRTRTVFVVRGREGDEVVLEAQNNLRRGELIAPIELAAARLDLLVARLYAPRYRLLVDVTEGHTELTRADGVARFLEEDFAVGDAVVTPSGSPLARGSRIAAIDAAGRTIVLDRPARRTLDRVELMLFVRQQPTG